MYLTKYHIDIRSQAGRQLLSSDRQELHHIIMGCVFGETAKTHHILLRAEGENLYIQSDVPPKHHPEGLTLIYTQDRDLPLSRLQTGDIVRFNLMAMPVKALSQPRGENGCKPRGKRVFLKWPEERMNWLYQKGEKGGFSLLSCTENRRLPYHFHRYPNKGGNFTLSFMEFTGQMKITDIEAFRKTIHDGIGPERSFGCGLLFVLPRSST